MVTVADGHAEREAAKAMIYDACQVVGDDREITLGADKGYDAREFIDALQEMNVVPHVAQNTLGRRSTGHLEKPLRVWQDVSGFNLS